MKNTWTLTQDYKQCDIHINFSNFVVWFNCEFV
jgi:hypothetical protein